MKLPASFAWGMCVLAALLLCPALEASSDESVAPTPATPAPIVRPEDTNSQEILQAILQIQAQLLSNHMAIERDESEAKEAAAQNADALSNGLRRIEAAFSTQQEDFSVRSARELEAMQRSNRSMLIVAGAITSIAFLATLITGYFQWRASKVWAQVPTLSPIARGGRSSTVHTAGVSSQAFASTGPIEDSNLRFLGALERLEKRIQHLEQGSTLRINAPTDSAVRSTSGPMAAASNQSVASHDARLEALLARGKTMLKENNLDAAINCFDRALSLNPNNPEALVKKGATLERLKKVTEAFEYYDLAIAADKMMTSAYLHKGNLYNRLERFKEALECYEGALQSQED